MKVGNTGNVLSETYQYDEAGSRHLEEKAVVGRNAWRLSAEAGVDILWLCPAYFSL